MRGRLLVRCAECVVGASILARPPEPFEAERRAPRATRRPIELTTEHQVSRHKRVAAHARGLGARASSHRFYIRPPNESLKWTSASTSEGLRFPPIAMLVRAAWGVAY